jgi:hypothetical protein
VESTLVLLLRAFFVRERHMPLNAAAIAKQIMPHDGEDQPAFSVRFHSSMMPLMPDTRARNDAMFGAWGDADGLQSAAELEFPSDKYSRAVGCEFKEHVAHNQDGTQSVYGRDELAAMCRNMNRRIADTGNYGTITDGHTPVDPDANQPAVLGHRGPYYLGQIGQQKARWAIFSTEHATHEASQTLKQRPTRSAEVWRSPRVEDRLIEPLAALGAEAPRLDLGTVRYARTDNGETVERYMASAMPGPMNTHVPGGRDKYAAETTEPAMTSDPAQGMSQGAIQAIADTVVDAIEQTPQWQFVTSLMQSGSDPSDPTDGMDADADAELEPAPEPEPVPELQAAPEPEPPEPEPPQAAPELAPEPEPPPATDFAPAPPPPQAPDKYADPDAGPPQDDSTSPDDVASLKREIDDLRQQVQALQNSGGSSAEQYRRERFLALQQSGYQLDVDREMAMVGDFSDDQFDRYAKSFAETRDRIPLASVVGETVEGDFPEPTTSDDGRRPEMERYSKLAMQHVQRERAAGRPMEYPTAFDLAKSGQLAVA